VQQIRPWDVSSATAVPRSTVVVRFFLTLVAPNIFFCVNPIFEV
jgi:hypothetical protein